MRLFWINWCTQLLTGQQQQGFFVAHDFSKIYHLKIQGNMSDEGSMRRTTSVPTIFTSEAPGYDTTELQADRTYLTSEDFPRKFSLPPKVLSSVGMKNIARRKSSADKGLVATNEHHHTKKYAKKSSHADTLENKDFFIPEEYLEAARNPGSLRDEINQLKTIQEDKDAFLDLKFANHNLLFGLRVSPDIQTR